jgi:hypothetical protein
VSRSCGSGENENVTSDQVAKFIIEILNWLMTSEPSVPTTPPRSASTTASNTNEVRIAKREKPSARSVPISRWRWETAAYMVIIAPIAAPNEQKIVMMTPSAVMNVLVPSDCFS